MTRLCLAACLILASFASSSRGFAQTTDAKAVPPSISSQPELSPTSVSGDVTHPASAAPAADTSKAPYVAWTKKSKEPYTGPTTIVQLPPTPMLDEEGRQRLDPDGKPMFNPPVKQQRDKYGHPLFDETHKPVFQTATELGFDEHGKKLHVSKEKPPKTTAMNVHAGVLTVDGLPTKAALNYDIADLHFLYFYAPWIGTAVVSNQPFPGAKEQPKAFDDKSLKVNVGDHTFELASQDRLLGKKPASAYVLVDRDFKLPTQQPVMGYGPTLKQPYVWPGAKSGVVDKKVASAPPLPENMRPVLMLSPCPKGQMRRTARKILPGETPVEEPCVPIVTGSSALAEAPAAAGGTQAHAAR